MEIPGDGQRRQTARATIQGAWHHSWRGLNDEYHGDAGEPALLTLPHGVANPVIKAAMQGNFLDEMPLTTTIHELLFKVTKDGTVFRVGSKPEDPSLSA